jgi:hypothetical protein
MSKIGRDANARRGREATATFVRMARSAAKRRERFTRRRRPARQRMKPEFLGPPSPASRASARPAGVPIAAGRNFGRRPHGRAGNVVGAAEDAPAKDARLEMPEQEFPSHAQETDAAEAQGNWRRATTPPVIA